MSADPIVGIEIGTSKVLAMVGEFREDGIVTITGLGEKSASGVQKGQITDSTNALQCVRAVLEMAEARSNVSIREVLLAVSGAHIKGFVNRGTIAVYDTESGITDDDVEEAKEVARNVSLPEERLVLHSISQHFSIDGQHRVMRPEGMAGGQLSHDMLILHGVRNRLNDAIMVVDKLHVDVHDMACSGLCSALAVLTPEQKRSGAIVIDIGGGTTDYVAYAEGVVAAAGVLSVGGDHITNDIGIAFSVPTTQAEGLKLDDGSAIVEKSPDPATISLAAEGGFPGRTINVRSLHTVIHLRCEEIMKKILDRLKEADVLHHVGAGLVLTGGSAHMRGMTVLAEKVFGLPCIIGKPLNVSGLATATAGPEYATVSGLVQYGFRSGRGPGGSTPLRGWLRGLFGK